MKRQTQRQSANGSHRVNRPMQPFLQVLQLGLALAIGMVSYVVTPPTRAEAASAVPTATEQKQDAMQQEKAAWGGQVKQKAAAPRSTGGWHLRAELATNVPLDISGRLTLEMPGRLRLSTSIGGIPEAFVNSINGAMTGAGIYDKQTADVIQMSFQEAIVWRLQAEWRPFARHGFYFGGGYGLLSLKGQMGGARYAGVAASLGIPSQYVTAVGFQVHSTIHMLNAELGWEWTFLRYISFRIAAGFTGTIASNTSITTNINANVPAQVRTAAQTLGNTAAASLDGIYQNYVFSPTISTALGFRFF